MAIPDMQSILLPRSSWRGPQYPSALQCVYRQGQRLPERCLLGRRRPASDQEGAPLSCTRSGNASLGYGRYSTSADRPTISTMRTSNSRPPASTSRRSSPGTKWTGC